MYPYLTIYSPIKYIGHLNLFASSHMLQVSALVSKSLTIPLIIFFREIFRTWVIQFFPSSPGCLICLKMVKML